MRRDEPASDILCHTQAIRFADGNRDVLKLLGPLTLTISALVGLWALLSDGALDGWIIGLPTIAIAIWAGSRLGTGNTLADVAWPRLLGFAPYFLWASVRGGVDVALRAVRPRLDVAPGCLSYQPRLESEPALGMFLSVVCLLPGTLSVRRIGDRTRNLDEADVLIGGERTEEEIIARQLARGIDGIGLDGDRPP